MKTLIFVLGATASGKTSLAVQLALRYGSEIISSDSMQIYRHMDIGTAKPTMEERCGIPHHMLDIIEPSDEYSAAGYAFDAGKCADDIISRGMIPVVAGGTGLYADALIGTRSFDEEPDTGAIRTALQEEARRYGSAALHEKLSLVDAPRAEKLHPNDEKRIIRALEIYLATGETATERDLRAAARVPRYRAVKIGLDWPDRAALYERINRRVDIMFSLGLVEEAARIRGLNPGRTASQAIGYKELFKYFDGLCTLEEAREDIKRESRRYAKRQLTWFRRDEDIKWIEAADSDKSLEAACTVVDRIIEK